ncbi:MAG: hypothetical protein L0Z62_23510 [Gemmataceae bacterium]|nr:hypothetical protein [Gemmataceae bacterium]
MVRSERTSSEWFREAARCYVERHQGCAWCGGSYRVFQRRRGDVVEYQCSGCDFRAGHDEASDKYVLVPGESRTKAPPKTMFAI